MGAFSIGPLWFKTKKAAMAEVRRVLHSATIDAPLTADDLQLISTLYELHPRREGNPVIFRVGINKYHGAQTRGFHAVHADGSHTAFSYIPCLNPTADEPSVLKVLRASIIPSQREILRRYYGNVVFRPCSTCKTPVQYQHAHVHHINPKFRDIADTFIGLIGMPQVRTSDQLGDEFCEPELRHRWIKFHDSVAQRVILCARCNADDEKG